MTTPDRRNTKVGNGTNNVSPYPLLPIDSNTSSHPVPQSNNISKAKKPPTFDGNTGWQDYLEQFEMIAAVNNWDDHTKEYEEPKRIDYCICFGVEYEPFALDQKRFNNPKQGLRKINETEESDDELVTRLSKISNQIGTLSFNTHNSDKAITCFCCGKTHVALCEAVEVNFDSAHTDINKLMNVTSFDESNEIPSHLTDLKERSSELLSEDQISQ
ncbi:unnamed protein product [Mytilus coruscus]|uniref:Uncharacterized protein n=1 Tax=Mytilus coruscus TaxID=42192 RepID=A0A6J8D8J4_MYTCO|nr:unnamed protein product [Mytilus coruscus]